MNILQKADDLTSGDRLGDYGHPIDDFTRTGIIWGAILGIDPVSPEKVGLCMAGLKISRECNRHKLDNLVDGAGYFRTVEKVVEEAARRSEQPDEAPQSEEGALEKKPTQVEPETDPKLDLAAVTYDELSAVTAIKVSRLLSKGSVGYSDFFLYRDALFDARLYDVTSIEYEVVRALANYVIYSIGTTSVRKNRHKIRARYNKLRRKADRKARNK